MEAVLGNNCAQSPASVWVASPGHTLDHCKVKCTLCSGQQVWRSPHGGLCASVVSEGGLVGLRFCHILKSFSDGAYARQTLRSEPHQWSAGLAEPALGAVLGCAGGLRGLRIWSHS